jgi:hypothetical protein
MSFMIAKELEGDALEELASRSDRQDAVTEAVFASQQEEHLGSVIVVVDKLSGACARMRAERLADEAWPQIKSLVLSKLEKEIARVKPR